MRLPLFALAAALVLGACASTVPATQISSRELSDLRSTYVRVVSNGQEFFCSRVNNFKLDHCYTRDQMKDLLLYTRLAAGESTAGPPDIIPNMSPYTFYTASGR